jgi:hypothetical protein
MAKKKLHLSILAGSLLMLSASAFMFKSSNGIQGFTGSPAEGTCSNCHGGGFSPDAVITITSTPSFSLNANLENEFMPDSIYQITIEVSASNFTKFGFASQILNSNSVNSGTLQSPGTGVKFLNSGAKRTAVHTSPKTGASNSVMFSYQWKAPSNGDAIIYAIANAVNGNNSTSGDFPVAPASMSLIAAPQPEPPDTTITGLRKVDNGITKVLVYPNPVKDICHISYNLTGNKKVIVELTDLKGTVVKELYDRPTEEGEHTLLKDFSDVPSGIYFIRLSAGSQKITQKLITLQH